MSRYDKLVEQFSFTEFDLRLASLRDLQNEQAAGFRKSGILTHAVIAADRNDQIINPEVAHWACVYKHWNVYGIRFTSYYADGLDESAVSIVDVPVYEVAEGTTIGLNDFDEDDVAQVVRAVSALEFEKEFGSFPDLTPDLTDLVIPPEA